MRSWIAAASLERLGAKIEELSERGGRLGTGPIELRKLEHRDGEVLVELSGAPPRLEGWEVVGRLEHLDGGPGRVSFAAPGLGCGAWSGAEPWCEHCGFLRHRTVTYLVRKGGGEIRQIGSSCLRHYTGRDLARALRQAELLESARVVFEQWREDAYLGPVGVRVKVQVEVQAVRAVGANRFGQVIWHGMSDRRGRWISWFASRGRRLDRGRRYELRGRVRRHGEWRGRPVTVLCRCTAEPI